MAFVLVRFSNNRKKKRSGIGYVEFMLPVEKKKSPCWTFIPVSSPEFFLKNKRKKGKRYIVYIKGWATDVYKLK